MGSSYIDTWESGITHESLEPQNSTHWALMVLGAAGKEGKEGHEGKGFEESAYKQATEGQEEMMEIIGWCIIGTLLALFLGYVLIKILRVDPK